LLRLIDPWPFTLWVRGAMVEAGVARSGRIAKGTGLLEEVGEWVFVPVGGSNLGSTG